MKQCKRVIQTVMDAVEIFIPSVMIVTLFVAFLIQVASRYIFKNPLVWPYELSQMAYLWVITLGCNYAQRSDDNIVFSVVYDLVPGTVKKIFTILSDAIICGVFLAVLPKVISFYEFYFTRYSTVFKLPLGLVYFGFLIFMVISILRYLNDMVRGILELVRTKKGGDKA